MGATDCKTPSFYLQSHVFFITKKGGNNVILLCMYAVKHWVKIAPIVVVVLLILIYRRIISLWGFILTQVLHWDWHISSLCPLPEFSLFISRLPLRCLIKCCRIAGVFTLFLTCQHASGTNRFQPDNLWSLGEQCGGGDEENQADYSKLQLHCYGK